MRTPNGPKKPQLPLTPRYCAAGTQTHHHITTNNTKQWTVLRTALRTATQILTHPADNHHTNPARRPSTTMLPTKKTTTNTILILTSPTLRHDHHREVVPVDQADSEEVEPTSAVERELGQGP
jgi:hypothetical protein